MPIIVRRRALPGKTKKTGKLPGAIAYYHLLAGSPRWHVIAGASKKTRDSAMGSSKDLAPERYPGWQAWVLLRAFIP
jgi:hypothetical protein